MEIKVEHPSQWIDQEAARAIRRCAETAESERILHKNQLQTIYDHRWFKMFIPTKYGGLGFSLSEALQLEEALSWADGSAGWVVTLCAGAGWFSGFIKPEIAEAFLTGDKVCIAGSGAVTGNAEETSKGYLINGVWKYASGALHATAFTLNCNITRNQRPVYNDDGSPKIATFILKANEVSILHTWNAMGMIATGSHSFEVKDLLVPLDRMFLIRPDTTLLEDPVYRYPFLQLAETTLAVNMSGMACRFLDLAEEILHTKAAVKPLNLLNISDTLINAKTGLTECRINFFDIVHISQKALESEGSISDTLLKKVSSASYGLVNHTRECLYKLYPLCGLAAAFNDQEINRVWRNFQTAGQHALFNYHLR